MTISIITIFLGIIGVLGLFFIRDWQNNSGKEITHNVSKVFESGVASGSQKTVEVVKSGIERAHSEIKKGNHKKLLKVFSKNNMNDIIRGKRKLGKGNGNGSKFLSSVLDAKKEIRDEMNGIEKKDLEI